MDGAFTSAICADKVFWELRVSARKESSVLDFGIRAEVGIGVHPGSERIFAHHGIAEKCDMPALTGSSIIVI